MNNTSKNNIGKLLLLLWVASVQAASAQPAELALADGAAWHESVTPAPLLDRQAFLERLAVGNVKLAPDGRHLVYVTQAGLLASLHVLDTAARTSTLLFSSSKLGNAYWSGDSQYLILELGATLGVLPLDKPSMPSYVTMLDLQNGDYLLDPDVSPANHLLVVRKNMAGDNILERINFSGASEVLATTPAHGAATRITTALNTADGATTFIERGETAGHSVVRIDKDGEQVLFSCAVLAHCELLAFEEDTNTLWLAADNTSNFTNLVAYSIDTGSFEKNHGDPRAVVDLWDVRLAAGKPAVVQYHAGTLRNHGLDDATQAHVAAIEARFPASNITPSISADGLTWLLVEESAVLRQPRYHLYDANAQRFTEVLVDAGLVSTALPAAALSYKIPVQYAASDGLLLHGYVSFPKGLPLRQTPLIALIHGGPLDRVDSNFAATTQFLVNRSYIVFEPNVRASTGYGHEYLESSRRDFGAGVVQQDIIDGVEYLLAQGIGDPQALAIMGSSFGGFSVLAGLAFTPELFKAGIASAAPADLGVSLVHQISQPGFAGSNPAAKEMMKSLIVDVDDTDDMQRLYAQSPLASLANITAPLLLLAGADDAAVPISHVKDYSLALFNQGKPVSLFIDGDEGHSLESARARLAFFYLSENFLGTYLDGKQQPLDDPALAAYITQKLLINANPEFSIQAE